VDQDVSEGDQPRQVDDSRREVGIDPRTLVQRLADDLELTLDGRSDQVVGLVLREAPAIDEPQDQVGRVQGVQR